MEHILHLMNSGSGGQEPNDENLRSYLTHLHDLKRREGVPFEIIEIKLKNRKTIKSSQNTVGQGDQELVEPCDYRLVTNDSRFLQISGKNAATVQEYIIGKYKVQEGNTVMLIDGKSGRVINFNGKNELLSDPEGIDFPWKNMSCTQILQSMSSPLVSNEKKKGTVGNFESAMVHPIGKEGSKCSGIGTCGRPTLDMSSPSHQARPDVSSQGEEKFSTHHQQYHHSLTSPNGTNRTPIFIRALFFAAFWCPPCRGFMEALSSLYHRLNSEAEKRFIFQVIYVSSDRSRESFLRFTEQMPWPAVSFEAEEIRNALTKSYNIKAIPSLVLMDENDEIITLDGRSELNDDLEGLDFPWYPRLVEELKDKHSMILNHSLCLIYFIGDDDSEYEGIEEVFQSIGKDMEDSSELVEALQPKFFIAVDSELSESLRIFIDLEETCSKLVIMDVPNFRYAIFNHGNEKEYEVPDEKDIVDFFYKFQTSQVEYKFLPSRFI